MLRKEECVSNMVLRRNGIFVPLKVVLIRDKREEFVNVMVQKLHQGRLVAMRDVPTTLRREEFVLNMGPK